MSRVEHIGDATLYLGDAREIVPGLPAGCADMIFTDPPYGHNNNNDGDLIDKWERALGRPQNEIAAAKPRPIANDGPEAEELAAWLFNESPRVLTRGGCCCCCCGGGGPDPMFARWSLLMDKPLAFKQMIVWDKGPMGMGWHYRRSYETVLVGQKRGGACKWHDDSGAVENIIRPGVVRKIIPSADQHPTAKPPELAAYFIRLHSLPGETVLDPFMGHGSTGVAAVSYGRKFIGVEIGQEFFDAACERLGKAQDAPLFTQPTQSKQEALL